MAALALVAAGGAGAAAPSGAPGAPVAPGTYSPPVPSHVVDPFRLEHGQYGPGNRGLEYATRHGEVVRAIAAGRVAFVGTVVGRLVLSIDHPDGRRSSLTGLATVRVAPGDLVARGTPVGTAAPLLHLGVREGRRYIDPDLLFGSRPRRAVLVPLRRTRR